MTVLQPVRQHQIGRHPPAQLGQEGLQPRQLGRELRVREVADDDLQPGRAFPRNDPYDNQSGEVETADGPLPYGQYRTRHEVKVTWLPIE